jgi:hypothetical protein
MAGDRADVPEPGGRHDHLAGGGLPGVGLEDRAVREGEVMEDGAVVHEGDGVAAWLLDLDRCGLEPKVEGVEHQLVEYFTGLR